MSSGAFQSAAVGSGLCWPLVRAGRMRPLLWMKFLNSKSLQCFSCAQEAMTGRHQCLDMRDNSI